MDTSNTGGPAHRMPWLAQYLFSRNSNHVDTLVVSLAVVFLLNANWLGFLVTVLVGAPISVIGENMLERMTRRANGGKQGE